MKILFFGDIFGRPGRAGLKKALPPLFKEHNPDFVIANAENIAHGMGVTLSTLQEVDELGLIDAYTLGNHINDSKEAQAALQAKEMTVVRPLNLLGNMAGSGAAVVSKGAKKLLIINLLGQVFMKDDTSNPFAATEQVLRNYSLDPQDTGKEHVNGVLIDFHAEATAEKRALGFYLDGKTSAVLGTHTHVPTRDEQILPKGTAYISDVGMVGPYNSIIGLDKDIIVDQYASGSSLRADVSAEGLAEIGCVLLELDKTGLAKSIRHLRQIVKIS